MPGFGFSRQVFQILNQLGRRVSQVRSLPCLIISALLVIASLSHCSQGQIGLGGNLVQQATQDYDGGAGDSAFDQSDGGDGPVDPRGGETGNNDTLGRNGPVSQPTVGGLGKNEVGFARLDGKLIPRCESGDRQCPPNLKDTDIELKIEAVDGSWWGPWRIKPEHYDPSKFWSSVTFEEKVLLETGVCTTTLHFEAKTRDGNYGGKVSISSCPPLPSRRIEVPIELRRITPLPSLSDSDEDPNDDPSLEDFLDGLPSYKREQIERRGFREPPLFPTHNN